MNIVDQIKSALPSLTDNDFINGSIVVQDDSDGKPEYIKEWNSDLPIPDGMSIGKLDQ